MGRRGRRAMLAAAIVAIAPAVLVPATRSQDLPGVPELVSFTTVEGSVTALGRLPGEGGLEVVAVTIDTGSAREQILLAPDGVLAKAGFEVQSSDRLRARVFRGAEGEPSRAHKVVNLTRGTMVKLRTLTQVPIWDAAGVWNGGLSRGTDGSAGAGSATGSGAAAGCRRQGGGSGGGAGRPR